MCCRRHLVSFRLSLEIVYPDKQVVAIALLTHQLGSFFRHLSFEQGHFLPVSCLEHDQCIRGVLCGTPQLEGNIIVDD